MAWHSDPDESIQNDWQARSAKKRDELSRSIEETLVDTALIEESFSDEDGEVFQRSNISMIIPPKLSLQSKQIPVVLIDSKDVTSIAPHTSTDPVTVPPIIRKKTRLAGRSTKVQLQAVPKTEKKSEAKIVIYEKKNSIDFDTEEHISGKSNSKRRGSSEKVAVAKGKTERAVSGSLAGSGHIKQGQREVMITNTHVALSSVVLVTLVENPGPVVIKYISLHPQLGFTLHFSDSAELDAQFNYVILLGELF